MPANNRHPLRATVANATAPAIDAGRIGLCIRVSINEPRIEEVLECGYDRATLERSEDEGETWCEVLQPSQRPVLESGKVDYVFKDSAGSGSFLYRVVYIETSTNERSDPSDQIPGEGLATKGVLSVQQLKDRYFFGLDITDDAGNPLPDSVFQHYILDAIDWLETELDIPLLPTAFCDNKDYHIDDFRAFSLQMLDNYPLISVEEFRVQYPSGETVIIYPDEWLKIDKAAGQIQVLPTAGALDQILLGQGGTYLPLINNGQPYLPQLYQVLYTAGFGRGRIPRNIVNLIGMAAAIGPFNIFGDLIAGAGIANVSLSMDGLSQSIGTTSSATNSGYGSRILQYQKQLDAQIPKLRQYYKRIKMVTA